MGFEEQWILLANSILERISSEVVIERKSEAGIVDRLWSHFPVAAGWGSSGGFPAVGIARPACGEGLLQREVGPGGARYRPTNDPPGKDIDDEGDIDETLVRWRHR
jgi:hypothetical protein